MSIHETIKVIQERADAATKGPWRASHGDSYCAYPAVLIDGGPHFTILDACEPEGETSDDFRYPGRDEDAEFIAHARTDVPALCRALSVAVDEINYLCGAGLINAIKRDVILEKLEKEMKGKE